MCAGTSISFLAYDQIYAQNLIKSGGERFAIPIHKLINS